jgi:hypothetical protein
MGRAQLRRRKYPNTRCQEIHFGLPRRRPQNGEPWPSESGYIAGFPRLNVHGEADVTADNSGASNDIFVKLVDNDRKPMVADFYAALVEGSQRYFALLAADAALRENFRRRIAHAEGGAMETYVITRN